jgi:AraC family transcriptional regulator
MSQADDAYAQAVPAGTSSGVPFPITSDDGLEGGVALTFFRRGTSAGGPEVMVARAEATAGYNSTTASAHIIALMIEGNADVEWRGDCAYARGTGFPGLLTLSNAGEPLGSRTNGPITSVLVCMPPSLLAEAAYEVMRGDPAAVQMVSTPRFTDPVIEQACRRLLDDAMCLQPDGQMVAEGIGHSLAQHLLHHHSTAAMKTGRSAAEGRLSRRQMRLITDYIQAHYADDLALRTLADLVGLSPYYFARQFKRTCGYTPHEYIRLVRVEKAMQLFSRGRMSVADVGYEVGFSDQSKFSTAFRRVTGRSPVEILRYRVRKPA